MPSRSSALRRAFATLALSLFLASLAQASTITIINLDSPGEGFNDPTVAAPVGGNPGTTVGQQRQNVFQQAANVWGGILPSSVTITCESNFDPLVPCSASSGVLGSTSPIALYTTFSGQQLPNAWYVGALANKLAGSDIDPARNDMRARFNSNVGVGGCLTGLSWYYGYDHNEGANQVDLLAVVLHELAHGLGFLSTVNSDGTLNGGQSDIFTHYIFDNTQQKYWEQMTNAQRLASETNDQNLVFHGTATLQQTPNFLGKRRFVQFSGDPSINGRKAFGTADFGPALTYPPVTGPCALVNDGVGTTTDACTAVLGSLTGKVAVIDRGTCAFTLKADNAQAAGAIAVIIVNNAAGDPPNMAGTDPTVTIPVVSITQADGTTLKNLLTSAVAVTASIGTEQTHLAGADDSNWPLLYAPTTFTGGSSVSHFDVSAFPNLLMEPAINSDLTSNVDLTRYVFQDLGWFGQPVLGAPSTTPVALAVEPGAPNPFRVRTSIHYALPRPGLVDMGIYDVSGRLVRKLMRNWAPAGSGSILWDATNDAGQRVGAGVYLYRVRSNGETQTERVVVTD